MKSALASPSAEVLPRPSLTDAELDVALVEFGRLIRARREELGLKRPALAKLAGVSAKHLFALEEKGANVTIKILLRVMNALELDEVAIGRLVRIRYGGEGGEVPAGRVQQLLEGALRQLGAAQSLLGGPEPQAKPAQTKRKRMDNRPLAPVISLRPAGRTVGKSSGARSPLPAAFAQHLEPLGEVALHRVEMFVAGEVAAGQPIKTVQGEVVMVPQFALTTGGEEVFRVAGESFADCGVSDGDYLLVDPRPDGRAANGEFVLALAGDGCVMGRHWNKGSGDHLLFPAASDEAPLAVRRDHSFTVRGAIMAILKL